MGRRTRYKRKVSLGIKIVLLLAFISIIWLFVRSSGSKNEALLNNQHSKGKPTAPDPLKANNNPNYPKPNKIPLMGEELANLIKAKQDPNNLNINNFNNNNNNNNNEHNKGEELNPKKATDAVNKMNIQEPDQGLAAAGAPQEEGEDEERDPSTDTSSSTSTPSSVLSSSSLSGSTEPLESEEHPEYEMRWGFVVVLVVFFFCLFFLLFQRLSSFSL